VSEQAAQSLADKIQGSWDSQGDGNFMLQATDQEVTSFLSLRLLDSQDLPLRDPQIWFTRGQVYASGELHVDRLPLAPRANIILAGEIDNGLLQLSVAQASFGQIPIPRGLVDSLESRLNGALAQAQVGIEVLELEILEAEAILVARPR
jgi:hypothetical protein